MTDIGEILLLYLEIEHTIYAHSLISQDFHCQKENRKYRINLHWYDRNTKFIDFLEIKNKNIKMRNCKVFKIKF